MGYTLTVGCIQQLPTKVQGALLGRGNFGHHRQPSMCVPRFDPQPRWLPGCDGLDAGLLLLVNGVMSML